MSGAEALGLENSFRIIMNALTIDTAFDAQHPILSELLGSGGMAGMLGTVWLIISAMVFGGAMEACGFLGTISNALLKLAKGTASLIATTAGTCIFVNVTASDQYLSIVVPGRMYADAYRKRGLAPENLSRTLEDSGNSYICIGTLEYLWRLSGWGFRCEHFSLFALCLFQFDQPFDDFGLRHFQFQNQKAYGF